MQLQINNKTYDVQTAADTPLLWVIRDDLGLTGTKFGCGLAQCGACSVLVDGVTTRSCVTPVEMMVGRKITTIEAILDDEVGERVVQAWVEHQVAQCGYCQSGQVIAATALLKRTATPTREEISAAMVNLCRCGTYNAIHDAIHALAEQRSTAPTKVPSTLVPALASVSAVGITMVGALAAAHKRISKVSSEDRKDAHQGETS